MENCNGMDSSTERFLCHFQKENITWSFWEAIKQHDITLFDCLITFICKVAQYPAAVSNFLPPYSLSLIGKQPGKAASNDFIV